MISFEGPVCSPILPKVQEEAEDKVQRWLQCSHSPGQCYRTKLASIPLLYIHCILIVFIVMIYIIVNDAFVYCCFASQQHLRSYQDGYKLVTVTLMVTFIVFAHWETRPSHSVTLF